MTYARQLQRIVSEYRHAGNPWPASAKDMAACASSILSRSANLGLVMGVRRMMRRRVR